MSELPTTEPKAGRKTGRKAEPKADRKAGPKAEQAGPKAKQLAEHSDRQAEPAALPVFKTYKLFVGGKFPRSESGRVYEVTDARGEWLANAPLASRKDARDAVVAARKAFPGWSGATAYNRGQVLYRVAEMLQGRREQFPADEVDAAVDRWVWYAGWTDKVAQVAGGANPVAGPFFNLSTPEPTGVVAVLAPQRSPLLGLVSALAPVIATGNTAVVVASESAPLPALALAEALATSDVPPGVVNILSGRTAELAPPLAAHQDVNAIDLTGAPSDLAAELEATAADTIKRVRRPSPTGESPTGEEDWRADPGTSRLLAYLETKTVWHPMGT
ncbi:aldehyde dehydrogenase family protein [Streptomyces sp. B6B3]|uniref:aldehyde dehydrogenase family protein n=1 Tax=Streptomyces sp. B6B3 TaxID=3153570 RepID=UPI00325C7159